MNHQRLAKWLPYLFLTMMAMEFVFIQMRTGRLIIGSDSIFTLTKFMKQSSKSRIIISATSCRFTPFTKAGG